MKIRHNQTEINANLCKLSVYRKENLFSDGLVISGHATRCKLMQIHS